MKGMVLYLHVDKYKKQWLEHVFGNPVRFPDRSFENTLIVRYLSKRPGEIPTELPSEDCVAIIIPESSQKPTRTYNHFPASGKKVLANAIDYLFRLDMWSSLSIYFFTKKGHLRSAMMRWCDSRGIDINFYDTVEKKLYRMRDSYETNGIVIGKRYTLDTIVKKTLKNKKSRR